MRKLLTALMVAALMFVGVGAASANATQGYHNNTFHMCTVDGRQADVYVRYEIWNSGFRLAEVEYSTDIAFQANAIAIYVEEDAVSDPGLYTKESPTSYPYGGGSSSLDDVPTYFHVYYVGDTFVLFDNHSDPKMKVTVWGTGQGAATGSCSSSYPLE